jgi:glycosyltransferase involved in cell wall biosynthesis
MKIEYVYYTRHDPGSAHTSQIIHTCNALQRNGHEVTLVSVGNVGRYVDDHGLAIEFDLHDTESARGSETFAQPLYYCEALWVSRSHDVVYTRDISFLKLLTLIPIPLFPPVIYEAHKSYAVVDDMNRNEELRRLGRASCVVTISNGIKEDIEAFGGTVDAVVRDAANTDLIPPMSKRDLRTELGITREKPVFVYAGSLDPNKYDIESVISAIGTSNLEYPFYVLGGEQPHIKRLREHSKVVGAEDGVEFLGRIPHRDVFKYLKAADIGIVAQQPTDIRAGKYTSPLKLFEYLACGLTVVGTDVPSIAEVAADEPQIILYKPQDIDDLQETLEIAVKHRSKRREQDIKKYTYERRAQEISTVLQECVD